MRRKKETGKKILYLQDHIEILAKLPKYWMLRRCEAYSDELRACRSVGGRLHQYYVHGGAVDCAHWKESLEDCKKWKADADVAAAVSEKSVFLIL